MSILPNVIRSRQYLVSRNFQFAFLVSTSVLDSRGWRAGFRHAVTSRQTYLSAALALAGSAGSVAPPVARAGAQVRVEVPPVTMG